VPEYILDPCVEEELGAIWEFIAKDNPEAARRVIDAARETFRNLARNPGLGRPWKFRRPRHQEIRYRTVSGFDNYVVFYREIPNGIQVHHVFHGARNIRKFLR
jgi:toxin ParE1/3/4